jgi:hypothetical protein
VDGGVVGYGWTSAYQTAADDYGSTMMYYITRESSYYGAPYWVAISGGVLEEDGLSYRFDLGSLPY